MPMDTHSKTKIIKKIAFIHFIQMKFQSFLHSSIITCDRLVIYTLYDIKYPDIF